MARIVLAHGLLGFGSVLPDDPLTYFNGIHALYSRLGHDVICPSVAPLGSIAHRASQLEAQILARWPTDDGVKIGLLAHSMGGLDCRRVLQANPGLARRVKSLVTVATPHYGSPVADAVLHPHFPGLPLLAPTLGQLFANDTGALADLQTRAHLQDADVAGVAYRCVGCDMAPTHPRSIVFTLTSALGAFHANANDGVVGLDSASRSNGAASLFQTWPVDHAGAVGWPSGGLITQAGLAALQPPADHIARYTALLPLLV
jgi:triacylglycerol lipase